MKRLIIYLIGILIAALSPFVIFGQGAGTITTGNGVTQKETIVLKPMQKTVLVNLDSANKAFTKDVEKNKDAISTFNALMQRSAAINEQSKQAYDLILEAWGYDPKKYNVTASDLEKGELKVEKK